MKFIAFLILSAFALAQDPTVTFPNPPAPCTPDTTQQGSGPKSCTPCCQKLLKKVDRPPAGGAKTNTVEKS